MLRSLPVPTKAQAHATASCTLAGLHMLQWARQPRQWGKRLAQVPLGNLWREGAFTLRHAVAHARPESHQVNSDARQ